MGFCRVGRERMSSILAVAGLLLAFTVVGEEPKSEKGGIECPHWISVMPLERGDANAIVKDVVSQGNDTIVDGIAWCCSVNPMGDPVSDSASDYAEAYRMFAPLVRSQSKVRQGILLQSTMGHGGFPGQVTPWQLAVKSDGTSVYRMCPLDERFLGYMAKTCRTFSSLKPDFYMIDDDTRLVWNGIPGCFCPRHLAAFAEKTGRPWTREELVAAVKSKDPLVLPAWEELIHDTMVRFFRTIRANFAQEIPGILCTCPSPSHFKHAKEYAAILAAPGQVPVIRGCGANYGGNNLLHCVRRRASVADYFRRIGPGVVYLQEADTCPQTVWSCSAKREYENIVIQALEGLKGAKIWITRIRMTRERRSQEMYRRILGENRGLMLWTSKVDFRQQGVVSPAIGSMTADGFAERYLAPMGIPYRYGNPGAGDVMALSATNLNAMAKVEIEAALGGRVILDGSAAVWLTENGFSDDIGVKAKSWALKTIQSHRDERDMELGAARTDSLFADLTERVDGTSELSRFYNVPFKGGDSEYVAPGALEYRNARGGRVIVFSMPLREYIPVYYDAAMYSETYKDWVIRLLSRLGEGIPGGVCFAGVGAVMCEAGEAAGDRVFVLDPVDIDDIVDPEMRFENAPTVIERLGGDGIWRMIPFAVEPSGFVRLRTIVNAKMPAIFRYK